MNNIKGILRGELIGLTIWVIDSENASNIGIKGTIINETKHMLMIKTKGEVKKIIKKQNTLIFKIAKENIKINGKKLVGRPEERIKNG
jgi:ribonuclease P protein subunit POP4